VKAEGREVELEIQVRLQRGLAAHKSGDLAAAADAYRSIIVRRPDHADALHLLGLVAFAERDFVSAESYLRESLAVDPSDHAARYNLAKTYEVLGRTGDALATYRAIPPEAAQYIESLVRMGVVAYGAWQLEEAAQYFEHAIRLSPVPHIAAAVNLGIVYNHLERFEDGVKLLSAVLEAEPHHTEARLALADSFRFLGFTDAAIAECHRLLDDDPDDVAALIVIGRVLYDRGAYSEAEIAFARAADLAPERHEPHTNLNVLYHGLGELASALTHGEAAVALAPDDAEAHVNLAMSALMSGDFARGWPEFEWRFRGPKNAATAPYRHRVRWWDGAPLDGELLVAREQGVGDFIAFSRFFPQLRSRASRLAVECPKELVPLYASFPGIDTVIAGAADATQLVRADAFIPLGSVPYALGIDAATLPAHLPYLSAEPARRAHFAKRYADHGDGMRVGIVWGGSPLHGSDRYRSCGLDAFAPLAHLPGISWIALQKGPREEEAREAPPGLDLLVLAPDLHDFADTAAAIAELDLVISVDTSVAHLAGALGAQVWTLLGFETYWLWGASGSTTPWYPTMRLFRQPKPNDWNGLFEDVRSALGDFCRS
jgi:tetratricopeptide (TPR) repeat protein